MNGAQMAEVVVRHHITWADSEAVCACGWRDIAPLFGYHLLGELLDLEDALTETEAEPQGVPAKTVTVGAEYGEPGQPASDEPVMHSVQVDGVAEPPMPIVPLSHPSPVVPTSQDEAMFALIRADPRGVTYASLDREMGLSPSSAYQRLGLLQRYGTLPEDVARWRVSRSKAAKGGYRSRPKDALGRPLTVVGDWTPLCMTRDEYGDWQRHNERLKESHGETRRANRPCEDCPLSFALEKRAEGLCNGEPGKAA